MQSDLEHHRQKLKALIARKYAAHLMNNTKWREVFGALSQAGTFVEITWISGYAETSFMPIPEILIQEWGLADPGIGGEGGPFFYEEIESLVIRESVRISKWHDAHNNLIDMEARLSRLGALPIERTAGAITLRGYQRLEGDHTRHMPDASHRP